jgi:ABC-type sulfate transport system permease subunit
MSNAIASSGVAVRARKATEEEPSTRLALIALAVLFLAVFILAPLAVVFTEAFSSRTGRNAGRAI